ncbi:stage v sporulation k [Pyrenophora seminiperda CCB06]|uniref:Stage v sporulation k n=1 Tax=Pyrenophora seminiperda CCB06 TaxID=1302712 RepID=A0A3M7MA90_9PLEO|nr:stage v sporulation k [Pyrenophora seminiperda CCB06]
MRKTTVARLYAKFLCKVGALPGDQFVETSGSGLANDGINACKKHIESILNSGGGVFFIDEAYQLVSGNSSGGKAVLDYLLTEIENLAGKIAFVFAGYNKQMETFFTHNPGIPSRIPIAMEFKDYEDEELLRILEYTINKRYNTSMKVEGGMLGLYTRIVARRIGRGRGREGFGNAREVQNRLAIITERQAKRLKKERRGSGQPDDNLLTKVDLIGPEPSLALKNNAAWTKLQRMVGLKTVKQAVKVLLDTLQYNYQRELEEKPIVEYSLNRCFIGSPGTGKTSVAKLYGRILADLGMLSNGEVVVRNPSDFVGEFVGKSEALTKAILASTIGKVLIIDEAYMLRPSKNGSGDCFKTAVIDTLVAEVQSTPGEDRCVLLLGYKDEMENMFRDTNPGMARRFPLDSGFLFEDFDDNELRLILELKLKDQGFGATHRAKEVAMDILRRARNRPHFGNGGEVDIILDKAKLLHQKHLSASMTKLKDTFEPFDFDPEFDRGPKVQKLLEKALGKVLFIDEAYRLAEGKFATEAMDELVDSLTKPKYAKKLICILAGYDEDMNRLMSMNPGLTSRFPETINFRPLTREECFSLLTDLLRARKAPLDVSVLTSPSVDFRYEALRKLKHLSALKSWGNARDVQTMEKDIFKEVISTAIPPITSLVITESIVLGAIDAMLAERSHRDKARGTHRHGTQNSGVPDRTSPPPQSKSENVANSNVQASANTNTATPAPSSPGILTPSTPDSEKHDSTDEALTPVSGDSRDDGVDETLWQQLQQDKQAAEAHERDYQRLEQERILKQQLIEQEELLAKQELERLRKAEQDAKDDEERRHREAERIKKELAMRKLEEMRLRMEQERQRREEARLKEVQAQMKLRKLGVCVQGYRWTKQAGGYRCAGGAHFVTDAQLGNN